MDKLETFLDGVALRRIVERYGIEHVRLVLDALAANSTVARPIRIPATLRSQLEEHLDHTALRQARVRDLEDGLTAILESGMDAWRKRQMTEIVKQTIAGRTAAQIAKEEGVGDATIERRLKELREAAARLVRYADRLRVSALEGVRIYRGIKQDGEHCPQCGRIEGEENGDHRLRSAAPLEVDEG